MILYVGKGKPMMRRLGNSSWVYVTAVTLAYLADAVEALEDAGNVVIDVVPLYDEDDLAGALIRCASDVNLPPAAGASNKG